MEGDAIALAQACLSEQGIVAVKGLGGFHLACKIDQEETLRKLRQRKHRDEKPFAIMCASVDEARKLCYITPEEEAQLTSFRRPIVLLRKRTGTSPYLSENLDLGVMLPYTPLHYLLMEGFDALVMTSANRSDCPVMYDNDEAVEHLQGIADGFLVHNRDIVTRCDDSRCGSLTDRRIFCGAAVATPHNPCSCRRIARACWPAARSRKRPSPCPKGERSS